MRDTPNLFLYTLLVFVLFNLCRSSKILIVFPMVGKSHETLGRTCAQLLLDAGHQVTYVKWGPDSEPHQNLTVIDITIPIPLESRYSLKRVLSGNVNLNNMNEFTMIMSDFQRKIMQHEKVQKLLHDPNEHFDVAVLEWIYGEYIVGLPAIFGCPYIWFSSMEPHSMILGLIGEITNPAYTPMNYFHTVPPFSFMERVMSLKEQLAMYLYREYSNQPTEEKDFQRLIAPLILKRRGITPSYNELRYNASLVLGNSHISVGRAIPLPASYKDVGGYHVEKSAEALPKDIELLMNKSTDGVIYFSLGSGIKSKELPVATIEKILKTFSRLKQTILWKFEEDLPNKPSNVHIVSWAPQRTILAHPNCILFISHGGQLSVLETVHYGVPIIGVPIFVDQHVNVKTLVAKGMAKLVDVSDLGEDLEAAITEILSNPSYSEAAKHQSFIYHQRPVRPGDELVYWVEYVIKTKGATHLRSISLSIPWYQKSYLDLVLVIIVILVLLVLTVKRLLSIMSNRLERTKVNKLKRQ